MSSCTGRSPYGERGLKLCGEFVRFGRGDGRSPYGERGLKYVRKLHCLLIARSFSLRRAWIEIVICLGRRPVL